MILSIAQIKKLFHISQTIITQCRRIIKDHPDRYGAYGVIGTLTHGGAFLDAYVHRNKFMKGYDVPPYNEAEAVQRVKELMDTQKGGK